MLLHANLEKKLPQNLAAEINTTAPPSAHPKLSPYKSPIAGFFMVLCHFLVKMHRRQIRDYSKQQF